MHRPTVLYAKADFSERCVRFAVRRVADKDASGKFHCCMDFCKQI